MYFSKHGFEVNMIAGCAVIKLQAGWVHSLKEKRMIVKSIISKAKNKFNISIAEVDAMDIHQTIVIGMSCVSNNVGHANSIIDEVVHFIEANTEAEIESVITEII